MNAAQEQPILRCGRCKKPFDKESSLKRHGYYCRDRDIEKPPKARSCLHCARAKVKCDTKTTGCSRCSLKKIECRYPADASKRTRAEISTDHENSMVAKIAGSSETSRVCHVEEYHPTSGNDTLGTGSTTLAKPTFEWDDASFGFDQSLTSSAFSKTDPFFSSLEPFWASNAFPITATLRPQDAYSFSDLSFLVEPTQNPRSLVKRQKMTTGAQRATTLLMHSLRSYPLAMRGNTLPPFMHPKILESLSDDDMQSWSNCISLVQIIGNGVKGSSKLFWRTVRMECERWRQEIIDMNFWQLSAALQALLIYIIIRLDEDETENNNLDSLLVSTTAMLSNTLYSPYAERSAQPTASSNSDSQNWQDWIVEECGRRLCTVYQVVNMLVFFEPAGLCNLKQAGLILAPLPAKRQLWEAGDQVTWKQEMERDPELHVPFGLATNGELVKLDAGPRSCRDVVAMVELVKTLNLGHVTCRTASWEEWCLGMDGFGGLIMLAASMIA